MCPCLQVRGPGAAAAGRGILPLRGAEQAGRAPAEKIGGPRRVYVSTEVSRARRQGGVPVRHLQPPRGWALSRVPRGIESLLKWVEGEGNRGGRWCNDDAGVEAKGTFSVQLMEGPVGAVEGAKEVNRTSRLLLHELASCSERSWHAHSVRSK